MTKVQQFSKQTIEFIRKASKQKRPDWLERNHEDFEKLVRFPLQGLAAHLATKLRPQATGYHFPLKGLGRLKRSTIRAAEYGSAFKSYVSFTITRPSKSRFDHNPSIFFMINSEDTEGDEVLLAGGLYMPSSRQLKSIRESIAADASPYEELFRSKAFKASFPDGFSDERKSSRPPRGFDPNHKKLEWLKLQGFFVWRSYRKKEYTSAGFPAMVAKDAAQILRLNQLLENAIGGNVYTKGVAFKPTKPVVSEKLVDRLSEEKINLPTPDWN